jgi:hypothetical protein
MRTSLFVVFSVMSYLLLLSVSARSTMRLYSTLHLDEAVGMGGPRFQRNPPVYFQQDVTVNITLVTLAQAILKSAPRRSTDSTSCCSLRRT